MFIEPISRYLVQWFILNFTFVVEVVIVVYVLLVWLVLLTIGLSDGFSWFQHENVLITGLFITSQFWSWNFGGISC